MSTSTTRTQDAKFSRKRVPASLSELNLHLADPETGRPYELLPQGGDSYKLCAVFNSPGESQCDGTWRHPAGRHCFELLSTAYR